MRLTKQYGPKDIVIEPALVYIFDKLLNVRKFTVQNKYAYLCKMENFSLPLNLVNITKTQ